MLDPKFVRRGLFLVFIILFLDIIGIAIIMPVLPVYLEQLTGGTVSDAAVDGGWLMLIYSLMQFLFAPLLGNLSDRFGRRPILLLSVLTFAFDNFICAVATSYWMLFVGRVLAGISGGSFATCSAYIADISNEENRAKNFGLIGIAFGVGFTVGPVIGGFLGEFGPRVPFFGAAALSFVNFVAACFLLPETLDAKNRRRFEWKRANPLGALRQMRHYHGIGWVCLVMFLFFLACRLPLGLVFRLDLPIRMERRADRSVSRHLRHRCRTGHGAGVATCRTCSRRMEDGAARPVFLDGRSLRVCFRLGGLGRLHRDRADSHGECRRSAVA